MKNIYYYCGREISIGEIINLNDVHLNDVHLRVTEQILEDNSRLFNIKTTEEVKQELLKEALTRYSVGDVVKHLESGIEVTLNGEPHLSCTDNPIVFGYCKQDDTYFSRDCILYEDGKWAEIVKKPVFHTEDGVGIHVGDNYCSVQTKQGESLWTIFENKLLSSNNVSNRQLKCVKRFSTRELANKYIQKNKPKTLVDYENTILPQNATFGFDTKIESKIMYSLLKRIDVRLYWRKIYTIVADDLNKDWKPMVGKVKYFIYQTEFGEYEIKTHNSVKYDLIYFKSTYSAQKAIAIMGDKLKIIYK